MNEVVRSSEVWRWWPVPAVFLASLTLQKVLFENRYEVAGHTAEHLGSATAPFFAAALVVLLWWSTPEARRQPDVVLACGAWLAATVLVLVGNVRVVDDLIAAGLADAPTLGLPDVADHGLANLAPLLAEAAAVAMAVVLRLRGHVSRRVAIGSVLLTVVVPPWMNPGLGVIVLVVARCVAWRDAGRVPVSGQVGGGGAS